MQAIRRGVRTVWLLAAVSGLASQAAGPGDWVTVDYGELVDLRALTHSGDAVGALTERLRAMESQGRPEDERRAVAALLEPVLEPFAFVLSDVRDAGDPQGRRPWVEIGWLWGEGEAQPAWAALLRDRRIVMESDGAGRVRCFVPVPDGEVRPEAGDAAATARRAWRASLPVTAWPLDAMLRQGVRDAGSGAIEVDVYAYVHDLARLRFRVTAAPVHVTVRDADDLLPPDHGTVRELQAFLETGWVLEGARLEPGGRLRLVGSPPEEGRPPTVLGRPWGLADVAAAYRAVFHGGMAEPYMSLDRDGVPWSAMVTYGGRFRDTSLGFVSLLSDIRFKTFSVGWDVFRSEDLRGEIRADLPSFRTHAERMAADPRARRAGGQQTRLWFYPDDVQLVLSSEADVMVFRRARMTAAAERMEGAGAGHGGRESGEPPWTRATVAFVNQHYDALARRFPELGELDHVARWLALFAWLRELGPEAPPDLPALLDVELPARRTPRRLPQLLALNVFPPDPSRERVQVADQSWIAEALHRLEDPRDAARLSAATVLRRAAAWLDPAVPAEAGLLRGIAAMDERTQAPWELDRLAYAAKRLLMHRRVLHAVPGSLRDEIEAARGRGARLFSLGMGGVDLGMGNAVRGASRSSRKLALGVGPPPRRAGTRMEVAPPSVGAGERRVRARTKIPPHGFAACGEAGPAGVACRTEEHVLEWMPKGGEGVKPGFLAVLGVADEAPAVRGWREREDGEGPRFLRLDRARKLEFAFGETEGSWTARRRPGPTPEAQRNGAPVPDPPSGVAWLRVVPTPAPDLGPSGSVTLEVAAGASRMRASVPRPLLWRLLLGREADPFPERPLPGLEAPPGVAPEPRAWMVLAGRGETAEPWRTESALPPPEERAGRLAQALAGWWRQGKHAPPVVVGVDPLHSWDRLAASPAVNRRSVLILPREAWPEPWSGLRARLEAAWTGGRVLDALPSRKVPGLVVVAGAGAPRTFGRWLLRLASDPSMEGRYLVVITASDAQRTDLPARLLERGRLAAVAWVQGPPLRWPAWENRLREIAESWEKDRRRARPWEILPGLVWYF